MARDCDGRRIMKALIAIGVCGFRAVLVQTWPRVEGHEDPWGAEIEAVGSSQVDEMGLALPEGSDITGFWVWEGDAIYRRGYEDPPDWDGQWRRATDVDLMEALV